MLISSSPSYFSSVITGTECSPWPFSGVPNWIWRGGLEAGGRRCFRAAAPLCLGAVIPHHAILARMHALITARALMSLCAGYFYPEGQSQLVWGVLLSAPPHWPRLLRLTPRFPLPSLPSFGKRSAGSLRRGCECIVLEPSEMIVVSPSATPHRAPSALSRPWGTSGGLLKSVLSSAHCLEPQVTGICPEHTASVHILSLCLPISVLVTDRTMAPMNRHVLPARC